MTTIDIAILKTQLKRDEGLRLKPYIDIVGKITIGYGRNLSDSGINQLEAEGFLDNDITFHIHELVRAFPVVEHLDATRQIVLANMAYNMGVPRLSTFVQMWAAIRAGDYEKAANEMLSSAWATQVGARATRLATSMVSGELKV